MEEQHNERIPLEDAMELKEQLETDDQNTFDVPQDVDERIHITGEDLKPDGEFLWPPEKVEDGFEPTIEEATKAVKAAGLAV